VLGVEKLEAIADRGYYSGEEILACDKAGVAVTLPKPMTSGLEARGRFGKQDFVYLGDDDMYRCPAGEKLNYHYTNEEDGQQLRRYWTNVRRDCALKPRCTTGKERRITRWEHGSGSEAPRQQPAGYAGTPRNGGAHLWHDEDEDGSNALPDEAPAHATEMALHVLTYNLTGL
jgi:hypothetical protein